MFSSSRFGEIKSTLMGPPVIHDELAGPHARVTDDKKTEKRERL
jgi:hypothetical protein